MQAILKAAADILDRPEILERDAAVRGFAGDNPISFTLKINEFGSITHRWTEAAAPAPEGLALWIRPRERAWNPWFDRLLLKWEIKNGITVGHEARDPRFDAAFLVEGAPAHMIRRLLADEEARRGLLALSAAYVPKGLDHGEAPLFEEPMVTANEGRFVVHLPRWLEDAERAALLVRTVARLAVAAASIVRGEEPGEDPSGTSDYRGKGAQERRIRDELEVRNFRTGIEKRTAWRRRQWILGWALGGLTLIVYVAGILTYLHRTGQLKP